MRDEGLDWNELYQQISSIVPMYDIGEKKEDIGNNCKSLFDSDEKNPTPEHAMDKFREWMRPYKIYG